MAKFDDIFEIAADNHGLITSAQARQARVSNNELVQYARRGRINKVGHGLYQLAKWIPEKNDAYAWAVAATGPYALLFGESVVAMLELAPTNPNRIFVATPQRVRRKLPENLVAVYIKEIKPSAIYDGIPSQSASDAILACKDTMLPERLSAAAKEARRQGFVSEHEYRRLKKQLGNIDAD